MGNAWGIRRVSGLFARRIACARIRSGVRCRRYNRGMLRVTIVFTAFAIEACAARQTPPDPHADEWGPPSMAYYDDDMNVDPSFDGGHGARAKR
jgi:hypothetical protein